MIPLLHTSQPADSRCFLMGRTIRKIAPYLVRMSTPPNIFYGTHELAPKRLDDQFSHMYTAQPFAQHPDRQTALRATLVAIHRYYALHACDAA